MVPESGHWQTTKGFQRLSALAEKKPFVANEMTVSNVSFVDRHDRQHLGI